jgi:hypothetical protein
LAGDPVGVESGPRQKDWYNDYVYTKGGKRINELLAEGGLALAWDTATECSNLKQQSSLW